MFFKPLIKTTAIVKPIHPELQEYDITLLESNQLFKVAFEYILHGERVQHSFFLARCVPWTVSKKLIGMNKQRFERKVLRCYKQLMEL